MDPIYSDFSVEVVVAMRGLMKLYALCPPLSDTSNVMCYCERAGVPDDVSREPFVMSTRGLPDHSFWSWTPVTSLGLERSL